MSVRIVEVGPRDGLQNEATAIPTDAKLRFIAQLIAAGDTNIEATSFVSPKWVPQLSDAVGLWPQLPEVGIYSALVPNMRGLERAIECGVKRIALFTAASDTFTKTNINMSVDQSLETFREVAEAFLAAVPDGWIRGYVSTAFECPYEGKVDVARVVSVSQRLLDIGVDEISIGDTIGVAVPNEVESLTKALLGAIPVEKLAYHFHDTRGTAIANVAKALEMGVEIFDASAAGLGGCPYAKGAGGNLATEDLVYFLERSGIPTGIKLAELAGASKEIMALIGREPAAKAQVAELARSD
ncbi:hydroxymethylglutaryl-CoA lyase [soil metagenome]